MQASTLETKNIHGDLETNLVVNEPKKQIRFTINYVTHFSIFYPRPPFFPCNEYYIEKQQQRTLNVTKTGFNSP